MSTHDLTHILRRLAHPPAARPPAEFGYITAWSDGDRQVVIGGCERGPISVRDGLILAVGDTVAVFRSRGGGWFILGKVSLSAEPEAEDLGDAAAEATPPVETSTASDPAGAETTATDEAPPAEHEGS